MCFNSSGNWTPDHILYFKPISFILYIFYILGSPAENWRLTEGGIIQGQFNHVWTGCGEFLVFSAVLWAWRGKDESVGTERALSCGGRHMTTMIFRRGLSQKAEKEPGKWMPQPHLPLRFWISPCYLPLAEPEWKPETIESVQRDTS